MPVGCDGAAKRRCGDAAGGDAAGGGRRGRRAAMLRAAADGNATGRRAARLYGGRGARPRRELCRLEARDELLLEEHLCVAMSRDSAEIRRDSPRFAELLLETHLCAAQRRPLWDVSWTCRGHAWGKRGRRAGRTTSSAQRAVSPSSAAAPRSSRLHAASSSPPWGGAEPAAAAAAGAMQRYELRKCSFGIETGKPTLDTSMTERTPVHASCRATYSPARADFREGSEKVPRRFREGSEKVPRRFRVGSAAGEVERQRGAAPPSPRLPGPPQCRAARGGGRDTRRAHTRTVELAGGLRVISDNLTQSHAISGEHRRTRRRPARCSA